jgi:hypothetical protein
MTPASRVQFAAPAGRWGSRRLRSSRDPPAYDAPVPRTWLIAMAILVACLIASIVIALVRLL